jgi:hypothetical protein
MFSSFSIFWWFPDFKQNGYLNKVTNIFNNSISLECRLHSEGFFIQNDINELKNL